MTDRTVPHPRPLTVPDLGRLPALLRAGEPVNAVLGLALLCLLPPLAFAAALDPREVAGAPVWVKPIKFALSLGLYCLTLSLLASFARPEAKAGRVFRAAIGIGAASIVFEMAYITLQAARGVGSHFNLATPLEAAMFTLMGVGAVLLTGMTLAVAYAVWRRPAATGTRALRAGILAGLVMTFVLTLVVAGTLAALGGPFVGAVPGEGERLALLGWSRVGGDLRVPHFFATHALQVVPLAVWLGVRLGLDGRRLVAPVAGGYGLLTLALFAEALAGRAFLPALG